MPPQQDATAGAFYFKMVGNSFEFSGWFDQPQGVPFTFEPNEGSRLGSHRFAEAWSTAANRFCAGGASMLVITRREGEEVVIGDPLAPLGVVRIVSIKGDRVRLAFDFPREITVHRREIANQINAADKDANSIAGQIRPAAGGENA